jgi:hypothetical protein
LTEAIRIAIPTGSLNTPYCKNLFIESLIVVGADVNCFGAELNKAVRHGDKQLVELLVSHGALVTVETLQEICSFPTEQSMFNVTDPLKWWPERDFLPLTRRSAILTRSGEGNWYVVR